MKVVRWQMNANDCEFEKVKFDFFKFVVLGQSLRAGRGLLKFAVVLEKPEGIFENVFGLGEVAEPDAK